MGSLHFLFGVRRPDNRVDLVAFTSSEAQIKGIQQVKLDIILRCDIKFTGETKSYLNSKLKEWIIKYILKNSFDNI